MKPLRKFFVTTLLLLIISLKCDAMGSGKEFEVSWKRDYVRKLLVVSIDGLSPDMFYMNETPMLNKMRAGGTYAHFLNSSFTSTPLSSLYSIATGRHPHEHGVFGTGFWDRKSRNEPTDDTNLYSFNTETEILPIWVGGYM